MKVKQIGEFGLIETLAQLIPPGEQVVRGIGDDAAVLSRGKRGKYLLLATDTVMEKVHFHRSQGAARIGRKALAVNLSDLAAMGGIPLWAVVNLGVPAGLSVDFCRNIYRGMGKLARRYSLGIVGGDTFRSPDLIVLAVAVVGEVERSKCVFRDGARPGDVICLTGRLGGARKGKHLDFTPRLREGRYLVENFSPTAMIDLSDGLFADLEKLCRASGVGAVVGENALPVVSSPRKISRTRIAAGEEFELLFTLPEKEVENLCRDFRKATGTRVTAIGKILSDPSRRELVDKKGRILPFPAGGYNHFTPE